MHNLLITTDKKRTNQQRMPHPTVTFKKKYLAKRFKVCLINNN